MSIQATLANLFSGAPKQQETQQTQPQPGNLSEPNTQPKESAGTATNGTVPNNPESPLDKFSGLWETDSTKTPEQPMFSADPNKIMEAARQQDFSKLIKPEQLQAITQGGEGATKAFVDAMNSVAQATYAQSAMATTRLIEAALSKQESKFNSSLPDMIKRHRVGEDLVNENPALNHAATQPIISALQQQLVQKYPNATSSEIKSLVNEYMTNFASIFAKEKPTADNKAKSEEADWGSFL